MEWSLMRSTPTKLILSTAVATTVAALFPATSRAVVNPYLWNVTSPAGTQQWQAANWTGTGGPQVWPSTNLDTADLRVGLTSNLTLDVGATNVSTAALYMGGTGAGITTDVTSSGGQLVLENADTGTGSFNGGNVLLA